MRPVPIAPMFILLLGAFLPKTEEGTMVGIPSTTVEAIVPLIDFSINFLLDN
jgi:hypothetical protein